MPSLQLAVAAERVETQQTYSNTSGIWQFASDASAHAQCLTYKPSTRTNELSDSRLALVLFDSIILRLLALHWADNSFYLNRISTFTMGKSVDFILFITSNIVFSKIAFWSSLQRLIYEALRIAYRWKRWHFVFADARNDYCPICTRRVTNGYCNYCMKRSGRIVVIVYCLIITFPIFDWITQDSRLIIFSTF